jgi:hypothetical protein
MIYGINYADNYSRGDQIYSTCTAKKYAQFDEFIEYSPADLDPDFISANAATLSSKRGGGFWLWKPYVILKTLKQAKNGDFIFYADSDYYYVASIRPLIQCMKDQKRDIMLFSQNHFEGGWTKRDILAFFGVVGNRKYTQTRQLLGGFQCYRKTEYSMEFVEKLLRYSATGDLITDAPSVTGTESRGFKKNRHDQSFLSLLGKTYGIRPHRRPDSPRGRGLPGDAYSPYGQIFKMQKIRDNISLAQAQCAKLQ